MSFGADIQSILHVMLLCQLQESLHQWRAQPWSFSALAKQKRHFVSSCNSILYLEATGSGPISYETNYQDSEPGCGGASAGTATQAQPRWIVEKATSQAELVITLCDLDRKIAKGFSPQISFGNGILLGKIQVGYGHRYFGSHPAVIKIPIFPDSAHPNNVESNRRKICYHSNGSIFFSYNWDAA